MSAAAAIIAFVVVVNIVWLFVGARDPAEPKRASSRPPRPPTPSDTMPMGDDREHTGSRRIIDPLDRTGDKIDPCPKRRRHNPGKSR